MATWPWGSVRTSNTRAWFRGDGPLHFHPFSHRRQSRGIGARVIEN